MPAPSAYRYTVILGTIKFFIYIFTEMSKIVIKKVVFVQQWTGNEWIKCK